MALRITFPDWTITLLRRLLYAWVRTRVFPQDPAELGLDPALPVCYVLQYRRLTNLLVLEEETRRAGLVPARAPLKLGRGRAHRSFFFLTRPQLLQGGARDRYGHSPLMGELVRAAVEDISVDVQVVPVTILWGQSPGKQDSILKALFAETWRPPGLLRQTIAILLHGRNLLVRFNAPLSLRSLLEPEMGEGQALRKLARVLRQHFRQQREAALGPDLSHRNTQIEALLGAPTVRAAIADAAAAGGLRHADVVHRARGYALEIASDYSYGVVRAFEIFLDWLWNRLYDGIVVHRFNVVADIAPGQGLVYVPCHRSHIDYLLLSFVIYRHGLTPPHVAAGANLNMPLVGPLLRRGGAFFLRRSFKGNPLYAAVFDEYLHRMISRGFPIEYFIEGGRSRSGRMLAPKTGMLAMTVKSFLRGHERPLSFVPVYIGYEKLLEGASFVDELAGKPKQGESLWGLLCAWRRLRDHFGKVHVNFGRPLDLATFLDSVHPAWRSESFEPRAEWVRAATREVADDLARRINEAAVVTPVNLVALVLLATPRRTADLASLARMIGHYQALLAGAPEDAMAVPCAESAAEMVAHAEQLGFVERIAHPLGELLRCREGQADLLAYFRNNVLHLFALPALVACLLSHNLRLPQKRVEAVAFGLHSLLRPELFLNWRQEEVPAMLDSALDRLQSRGLVVREGDAIAAPPSASAEHAELRMLGETLRTTLERHFLTLALLQRHGSGTLTRAALAEASHLLAQRLALLFEFNAPEFSEKGLFSAVIANLVGAGLLAEDEKGLLRFDARITAPAEHAELLLSAEVRQAILRMTQDGAD